MLEKLEKYNFWDGNVQGTGQARPGYLNKLAKLNNSKTIVAIMGLRRVGKSFLLRQFIDYLLVNSHVEPRQIFYANLYLRGLDFLKNPEQFQQAITLWQETQKVDTAKRMYIFIDEVQEIDGWQKLVSSLYEDYTAEYKLFVTGSNSRLLSGELGTYLAGRSHDLTVYPQQPAKGESTYE